MMTIEYLEAARKQAGVENSAQLAARLGITRAAMSRYEKGQRIMDDYTAAQIAEILGLDPMKVIAQANAERETDAERIRYWNGIISAFASTVIAVLLTVAISIKSGPAQAFQINKNMSFALCKLNELNKHNLQARFIHLFNKSQLTVITQDSICQPPNPAPVHYETAKLSTWVNCSGLNGRTSL